MTTVIGEVVSETTEPIQDEPTQPTEPTVEVTEAEEPLPELVALFGSILAADAEFKAWVAARRGYLFERMLAVHKETGAKSFSHQYGSPKETVTFSLRGTDEKYVISDEKALVEFVEDHFSLEVETITIIKPAFLKKLLDNGLTVIEDDDGKHQVFIRGGVSDFADKAGTEVPGVRYVPANDEPTSFGTTWGRSGDPKGLALAALRDARFGDLLGLTDGADQ